MRKTIFILFAILFFFVPLILWPTTSEVFEFNKIVLTYALTALIASAWAIRCIIERKLIFRRTILDLPLLVFLGSQLISTLLSIDPLTSMFGYYSRFNGGFTSIICYSLLFWAFVSNFDAKESLKLISITFASAALVSIYGVMEHFGIDKNLWVQDVQGRVFSTLGQPNWLAAWLVALMPLSWALALEKYENSNPKSQINSKFLIYLSLSVLFFWTLVFTKSRSGLLGLGVAVLIFGAITIWKEFEKIKKILIPSAAIALSILIIALISGTQLTPSLRQIIKHESPTAPTPSQGPALETGSTESGAIRKIVWKGAIDVWSHYPIFGTGVETFAYSYYQFRPIEHNLTTEWDFIYNKAHNEFLNTAANTGTVGIITYLVLIGFSIYALYKNKNYALLAGYISLLVTNFFGFSVVPTQLQFFLFPAIAIVIAYDEQTTGIKQQKKLGGYQKTAIAILLLFTLYLLFSIFKYWYADTLYAKGKAYNGLQKPDLALPLLSQAVKLEPAQPLYHNELASSYTSYALAFNQQKDANKSKEFADLAVSESDKAISVSPANVNLRRSRFGVFVMLSGIDPNYLITARDTLLDSIKLAPTDAKIYYNLALVYARTGQNDQAMQTLQKTIELKANYKEARLAYAILLIDQKRTSEAKSQLEYILTKIDPSDSLTKQTLESIK